MFKIHAPKSHPRYLSLFYRDMLADGVKKGITSLQGLTAYGRGEAFDYLLGEKTHDFAKRAVEAASAMLLLAQHPVLSVNGNTAILVSKELVALSQLVVARLEVNLFHASKKRERKIADYLKQHGAQQVLLPNRGRVPNIKGNRRIINIAGQLKADVVFVPLEDGDRTEALVAMGKKVITVDLNPISRTAQKANITIVDNIVRAMPLLIKKAKEYGKKNRQVLKKIVVGYNNTEALKQAEKVIRLSKYDPN